MWCFVLIIHRAKSCVDCASLVSATLNNTFRCLTGCRIRMSLGSFKNMEMHGEIYRNGLFWKWRLDQIQFYCHRTQKYRTMNCSLSHQKSKNQQVQYNNMNSIYRYKSRYLQLFAVLHSWLPVFFFISNCRTTDNLDCDICGKKQLVRLDKHLIDTHIIKTAEVR